MCMARSQKPREQRDIFTYFIFKLIGAETKKSK